MRSRARAARLLALAGGLVLLSGCTLAGEMTFTTESILIDVQVTEERVLDQHGLCDIGHDITGVQVTDRKVNEGEVTCRVSGELALEEDGRPNASPFVSYADGHQFLLLPIEYLSGEGHLTALDLTMHFAGPVVAAGRGGEVDGHSVRWRDVTALGPEGMSVTARTVALPPPGVVPAALGLGLGALGVGAAASVPHLRRRAAEAREAEARESDPLPSEQEPADESPVPPPTPTPPPPPEDPSVWAPDHR